MKSLHKVLDILEIIAATGSLGIRDLASRTGFPPATAHRIVSTLVQRGYLHQNSASRNYHLSTKFLELADHVQRQFDLIPIVRPILEHMMAETGENANLCVLDGFEVVYIDHVHSQGHMLQSFTKLGARVPLHATGVGKVFLGSLDSKEMEEYFAQANLTPYTSKTITDEKRLREEIRITREKGWAVDDQEKEEGVRCIAAPVFDFRGKMVAAVSVSGAVTRITIHRTESLANIVKRYAGVISSQLGHQALDVKN